MNADGQKQLLVVDDEKEICNFVKMFFELRGFQVHQANSGKEAIEIVESVKPLIVLLDVNMNSENDGIEALPEILKKSTTSKIFMTTGVNDEDVIQKAKNLGAYDYLTKPLVLEELEDKVMKVSGVA